MPGRFKSYFLRGLAVLVPTLVTVWIFVGGFLFFHDNVGSHIKRGLTELIILAGGSRPALQNTWIHVALSLAGFLIALVAVCIVGALLASVVGRALWRGVEGFIMGTPVLRRVYPYVKQITDFVLTQEEQAKVFSKVVAVEYPRKGVWSIGLVTGSGLRKIAESNKRKEFLTVLVPNSPTPVTGYVVIVPKDQTIPLNMTIEEAFRFAISARVIAPDSEQMPAALPKGDSEIWKKGSVRQ